MKSLKIRESNFELLRILSMFFIVLGHAVWQSDFTYSNSLSFNNIMVHSLWIGGKLGVNLFVLISAYFLSQSRFKWKSLSKLWQLTLFYSISIYLILLAGKWISFNLNIGVHSLFPVVTGGYWFVSAYIVMYLMFPYVNLALNQLNKKQLQRAIVMAIVIFMICTNIFQNKAIGNSGDDGITITVVYLIGYYIRKYADDFKKDKQLVYIGVFLISIVLMVLSVFIITLVRMKTPFFQSTRAYGYFLSGNSILQLSAATSLFLVFKNMHIKSSKSINYLAASMFSVYLIHCQPAFYNLLWLKIIKLNQFQNSYFVIFLIIGISILVFLLCTFIDVLRRQIIHLSSVYLLKHTESE